VKGEGWVTVNVELLALSIEGQYLMKTIKDIVILLNSENPWQRDLAMGEAQEIGSPEADAIIYASLNKPEIRYRAVYAISNRGKKFSIDLAEVTDKLLGMLHDTCEGDGSGIITIAEALFRLGFSNHELFIDLLLRDPDRDVREYFSDYIVDTDFIEMVEQSFRLLVKALDDDEELVRERATWVIKRTLYYFGRYEQPDDINDALIKLLNSEYPYVRATAAELLEYASADVAVKPLLKAVNDEDTKVRLSAIYSLGYHGYSSDVETLFELGSSHEDADVRFKAARALSILAPSRFVELVARGSVTSLNDGQYGLIAGALQRIGGKDIPKENIANAMTKLWESNQLT
jgi:HEAT repeat protein